MAKSTYYKTSQDWLEQSAELLRARPSTTRITTKYSVKKPKTTSSTSTTSGSGEPAKRAFLTLKTFDPSSGATLKYKTTKAAEVSRLVSALGMLGRDSAGLPPASLTNSSVEMKSEVVAAPAAMNRKDEAPPATGGKKKKGKK
ncbi:hypothetical protein CFIMG_006651RA [Ceratocystis fimbriata CBS 114723]|uniref:SRP9 domain-containing protein n=1 Tax=Ceratocystis fimbriata CBS 114723 TaxID=1035309 RepID=A0A2C5WWV2_9PEZI|nr:hypothetical protein CFIMG_006651RA [Ceratocystis fimbriata CBS 114723]